MRSNSILKLLVLVVAVALLAPESNARIIKIKDPMDGSIRSGDTIALDLNKFFSFQVEDMDKVTCRATQNTPSSQPVEIGKMFKDQSTPYYTKDYSIEKYGKGSFMKFIDEKSFIVFTLDGAIIYQQTKVNGSIDPNTEPKYNRISSFGVNTKCHDAIAFGHNES